MQLECKQNVNRMEIEQKKVEYECKLNVNKRE